MLGADLSYFSLSPCGLTLIHIFFREGWGEGKVAPI